MNTIYWSPSTDANIQDYLLARGVTASGPWVDVATVTHNLGGPNYNSALAKFFYVDNIGTGTDWYKLNARDAALQVSNDSIFQAGAGAPTPTIWTTSELLAAIKRAAMIPSTQVTFADSDLLSLADEELASALVPLVLSAREDYWSCSRDYATTDGFVRIPYRASAGKVRGVSILDASGNERPLTRIPPELAYRRLSAPAFYVQANTLIIVNRTGQSLPTLRVSFYLRPSRLVTVPEVARVIAFNKVAKTLQLNNLPEAFDASQAFDIMHSNPGFETVAFDQSGSFSGNVLTIPAGLPADVEVGDHVVLANESCIPQIPAELHPVLAQAVAARCLGALGDLEAEQSARAKLAQMMAAALTIISNRADVNPDFLTPASSPWRA